MIRANLEFPYEDMPKYCRHCPLSLNETAGTLEEGTDKPIFRVYLAGPMSGRPNFNRQAFFNAEKHLEELGFCVFNPATFPDGLPYGEYIRLGLDLLKDADAIVLLPGWEHSRGAETELHAADADGKPHAEYKDILSGKNWRWSC